MIMKNKNAIIIQARLTSKRFPEKVLKKIGKKTIVEIIYQRLLKTKNIDHIIFAIPNNYKNIKLKNFLIKKNIPFFCGSENNVLERYYLLAKKLNAKIIVRVTADCPMIDKITLEKMLKHFIKHKKIDYLGNTIIAKKKFPDGTDVEIFNFVKLKLAYQKAKSKYDKEHVTPYIIRNSKCLAYNAKNDFKNKRWTIDYLKDLKYVRKIFRYFDYDYFVSMNRILSKGF